MTLPTDRRIRDIGRRISRALVESIGTGFGRPLITAISGGADSSAMLLLLADTQSRHGWRLRAAHVDHRIQATEIREHFRHRCEELAAIAELPFECLEVDAPAEAAASAEGLESAARHVRYVGLTQLAEDRGAPAVTVAHTQDDQAETVLMHIIRGTGLDGLSGMPKARPLNTEVQLVRPLLDVSRAETEAVCEAYGWDPVHDPSNDRLEHTRNRIRHTLIPLMAEINPSIAARVAQLARAAESDRQLLDLIGSQTLSQLVDEHGTVPRRPFLTLPGQLQNRVVRALCREHGLILSAERTAAALQVIHTGHGVVEFPAGARLSVVGGTIRVHSPSSPLPPVDSPS